MESSLGILRDEDFDETLQIFKDQIFKDSGIPFEDFNHKNLQTEIKIKDDILKASEDFRNVEKRKEWKKGDFLDNLLKICEKTKDLMDRHGQYRNPKSSYESIENVKPIDKNEYEEILNEFFDTSTKTEYEFGKSFDKLIIFLKRKNLHFDWKFLSFLAFIANPEKYFPFTPKKFKKLIFKFYGEKIHLGGNFSSEKYFRIVSFMNQFKGKLVQYKKEGELRPIEVQSYLWLLSDYISKNTDDENQSESNSELIEIIKILENKKNLILYGPPGTGKTWTTFQVRDKWNSKYASPISLALPKISICFPTDRGNEKIEQFKGFIQKNHKLLWGVGWNLERIKDSDYPIKGYIYYKRQIIAIANIVNFSSHEKTSDVDLQLRPRGLGYDQDYKYYLHICSEI